MRRDEIQSQLNACEAHILELRRALAASDEHALKCIKENRIFEEMYPDEASAYELSRQELEAAEGSAGELRILLAQAIANEQESSAN